MKVFRKIPFVILLLPLVVAIIVWYHLNPAQESILEDTSVYQAKILTIPQVREKNIRVDAGLIWKKGSYFVYTHKEKVRLYINRDSLSETLQQGDTILFHGILQHANRGNPYEFDYDGWLKDQNIVAVCYLRGTEWLKTGHDDRLSLTMLAERCRYRFVQQLKTAGVEDAELGVVAAMTIGERSELDQETRRMYSAAGAMHVLAVSGLHTGIVYAAIVFLLSGFGLFPILYGQKKRKWITGSVAIVLIWCYAFVTGLSPSVMRAALMITIFTIGDMMQRNGTPANTLAAAAFINLLIRPTALFSISFQLSYSAVAGILIFNSKINRIIKVKNGLLRYIWQLFSVSVSAQLGTIPITLWYFQQTSNYFALTNLFVIALATIIIYVSVLFVILSPTPLCGSVGCLIKYLALILNQCVGFIDGLPGATTNVSITQPMLVMMIILIVIMGLWIHREKWYLIVIISSLSVVILFLHFMHLKVIEHTRQTIAYNTYPYTLILQQEGRACILYTNDADAAMSISEPLRKQMMIRQIQIVNVSENERFAFKCNGKRMLLLLPEKGHEVLLQQGNVADVLMVGGRGNIRIGDAVHGTSIEQIVMLSSWPDWKEKDVEKMAMDLGISVLKTKNGAVSLD